MAKSNKIKQGLGKGLGALISSVSFTADEGFSVSNENEQPGITSNIEIKKIITNPYQPRKDFDEVALEDLKNSIQKHGVITAITVRKTDEGYELISGERRVRASILAGLDSIPAYVLDVNTNVQMLEIALIENLQREDLNPIEVANGYQRLIEEYKYTQEQVAERVGRERSTISNFIRLLRLPVSVQDQVRTKKLSYGHARALVSIDDHAKIIVAINEIVTNNLSVRQTEQLVRKILDSNKNSKEKKAPKSNKLSATLEAVINEKSDLLRKIFGTQVKIFPKSETSGSIEFQFYSADDFERLMELFEKARE